MRDTIEHIRYVIRQGWYHPDLPAWNDNDDLWQMSAEWRRDYVATKYAISLVLRPRRICEIGVYSGISALCFMCGSPTAEYFGIDNLSAQKRVGIDAICNAQRILNKNGFIFNFKEADSQEMTELPEQYDFIHVDGDHSFEGAEHDVGIAWEALNSGGYILIDNGHDRNVCEGTFGTLATYEGLLDWAYFEHGVGSILVRKS